MNDSTQLLNSIYKSSEMGMSSTEKVMEAAEDSELKDCLQMQLMDYKYINEEAKRLLHRKGAEEKDSSSIAKLSSGFMINVKTFANSSPSHLAEMMIQGTTMGIVDTEKDLNKFKAADDEAVQLAQKLAETSQHSIDKLKGFLH